LGCQPLYAPQPGGKLAEVPRVIALCLCMLGGCFDPKLAFDNGHTNECGASQNCGICTSPQNFCCIDIPNYCTTQAACLQ